MWSPPEILPTAQEIVSTTSEVVAGLDDQKLRLATALRRHLVAAAHGRPYRQPNVLLLGPTGGGKTWMVRHMLRAAGCLHTEINATVYSETGYAGLDLSSMPIGFYQSPWLVAGEKRSAITPLAEHWGVIVIDEFDKLLFKRTPDGRDTGRSLQAELLRITEGDTVHARARDSEMGTAFNTHNILFIAMGAFEGLSRIVDPSIESAYTRAEPYHIQRYGFMEELVGRFSTIIALPPLREDHLYRIICEHIWPNWMQMAHDEGIHLSWSEEALRLFANQAAQRGIGARGLEPLIEAALWKAWGTVGTGQEIWLGPETVATGAVVRERDAVPV